MTSENMHFVSMTIPTLAIAAGVSHWPLTDVPQSFTIHSISGYLRALTGGTFTVTLRDMKDAPNLLISTLSFTGPGDIKGAFADGGQDYVLEGPTSGLRYSVSSIGLGADDCVVTVYGILRA
jgi:hypothetical protein